MMVGWGDEDCLEEESMEVRKYSELLQIDEEDSYYMKFLRSNEWYFDSMSTCIFILVPLRSMGLSLHELIDSLRDLYTGSASSFLAFEVK